MPDRPTQLGLSTREQYRPFDRLEKLGEPPWSPDDPKLIAWEKAHGHDVRLKCYAEFGCQVIEERAERIEEAAKDALSAWFTNDYARCSSELGSAMVKLREALDA